MYTATLYQSSLERDKHELFVCYPPTDRNRTCCPWWEKQLTDIQYSMSYMFNYTWHVERSTKQVKNSSAFSIIFVTVFYTPWECEGWGVSLRAPGSSWNTTWRVTGVVNIRSATSLYCIIPLRGGGWHGCSHTIIMIVSDSWRNTIFNTLTSFLPIFTLKMGVTDGNRRWFITTYKLKLTLKWHYSSSVKIAFQAVETAATEFNSSLNRARVEHP